MPGTVGLIGSCLTDCCSVTMIEYSHIHNHWLMMSSSSRPWPRALQLAIFFILNLVASHLQLSCLCRPGHRVFGFRKCQLHEFKLWNKTFMLWRRVLHHTNQTTTRDLEYMSVPSGICIWSKYKLILYGNVPTWQFVLGNFQKKNK